MIHEEALVRAFIRPDRQGRFLALLATPKSRAKLRQALPHFDALDARFAQPVPPGSQTPHAVLALLRHRGAPARCVCLSESPDLDGQELDLSDALAKVVGSGRGTFLSCLPGQLAYFEGEEAGDRWILQRGNP